MKLLFKILAVLAVVGMVAFGVTSFISACTGHINAEVDPDCESITVSADPQDWYDNKVHNDYLTWYKYVAPATGVGTFAWDPILAKTMDFTVTVSFQKWTRANEHSPWVNSGQTVQESETVTANRPNSCRWTFCHVAGLASDPANYITKRNMPLEAVLGHFNENGTVLAGHEQDSLGECVIPHCLKVTPVPGPWTEWAVDPVKDPTLATEYRSRIVQNVDFYDNTILCGDPYPEVESRTRDLCVVKEISGYGEWSEWSTDPSDNSKEIRTRQIYYVDGINHTTNCGTGFETDSRDRPLCQYNPDLYYNDPACHEPSCTYTTPSYGEWSDWAVDSVKDPTLATEYRHRDVTYLDTLDPTIICGSAVQEEQRPRDLCVVKEISGYGEWSEWSTDPSDNSKEIRTRQIYYVDGINHTTNCGTGFETDSRDRPLCQYNPDLYYNDPECHAPACTYTTPIYSEWSDWAVDPLKDPTLATEYRHRDITYLDTIDPTIICGSDIEYQDRPRDLCIVTAILGYGEWSDWAVDPLDPAIEYRTRDIYLVDGIDGKTNCGTDVQRETRERERCEWNPDIFADDPDCHAPACTFTNTVYGEWSDWAVDPVRDPTLATEFRHRHLTIVDAVDPTVNCGSDIEYQDRPRELCIFTVISGYGDWSDWAVDPLDPAIEYRTRDIYLVDGIDGTHSCGTDVQKETRERGRCQYNQDLWADDPDCRQPCEWNPNIFADDPACKQPATVYPCATCDGHNDELQVKPGDIVVTRYATCDTMPWCVAPLGQYTIWSDVYFYLVRLGVKIEPTESIDPSGQKWYTIEMPALLLGTYDAKNPRAGGFYLVRDGKDVDPSIVQPYNGACACTNYWHLVDGALIEKTVKDADGKEIKMYFYQMRISGCYKNSWETIQFVMNEYYPTVMGTTITEDEASKIVTPQWITGPKPIIILLPAPAPK
jgi:hypothetical protein